MLMTILVYKAIGNKNIIKDIQLPSLKDLTNIMLPNLSLWRFTNQAVKSLE